MSCNKDCSCLDCKHLEVNIEVICRKFNNGVL